MKYSILLVDRNQVLMDDFFTRLKDKFECLSTSSRFDDIANHLKYYTPDALVLEIQKDNIDYFNQIVNLKKHMQDNGIPLIILGTKENCTVFNQNTGNMAQLTLVKPLSASMIAEHMLKYLDQKKRCEEELKLQEEGLADTNKKEAIIPEDTGKQEEVRKLEEAYRQKKEEASVRKHVLVVDDNPLMLKMVKEHLHNNYDVATAISGKVALKFLENKRTDLILLDYEMPAESGPEVLEKIRANEATKNIPVMFLTGITEKKKIQKALVFKPQGYLVKPIDHEKLLAAVKKQIG